MLRERLRDPSIELDFSRQHTLTLDTVDCVNMPLVALTATYLRKEVRGDVAGELTPDFVIVPYYSLRVEKGGFRSWNPFCLDASFCTTRLNKCLFVAKKWFSELQHAGSRLVTHLLHCMT